jgi:hypothetical protein
VVIGNRIAGRSVTRMPRRLAEVRVYWGRPDPRQDPRTSAAHLRQCAAWEKVGNVTIRTRTLRYPRRWPQEAAEEKGIDVQLAIDFVMGVLRRDFDVGVVFSTDTDLLPALEAATEIAQREGRSLPEVAAWGQQGVSGRRRLKVAGTELRCHWLAWPDYQACEDRTDYNIAPGSST